MSENPHKPRLVFLSEPYAGRVYELVLEKTTVGRGTENTLSIHDSSISLAHCEILVSGPEVIVRDLGSANGTFVDGMRLEHRQTQLKSGHVMRFGSVEARLELDPSAREETSLEATAIYEHGQILRDQQREQQRPKPPEPSMTLDDGSDSESEEPTVLLPRVDPPQQSVIPKAELKVGTPRKRSPTTVQVVVGIVAVLGIVVVLWRLFRS